MSEAIAVFHVSHAAAVTLVRSVYRRLFALIVAGWGVLVATTLTTVPASHRLSFWAPCGVVFAACALAYTRAAVKQARRSATYQLTIGPNVLRIVQHGIVPTEVFRHDVVRILEFSTGLRIEYGGGRLTGVPRSVDGYAAARERLASWHAIERARLSGTWIVLVLMVVGLVGGGMALPRVALTVINGVWAAANAFWLWRLSRTSVMKKYRAGNYVVFGALLVWALLRLYWVWS